MGGRGRAGAVAAAGVVLGLGLLPAASGAQTHPRPRDRRGPAAWAGFAGNAQHTAVARMRPQPFRRIRWTASCENDMTLTQCRPSRRGPVRSNSCSTSRSVRRRWSSGAP